MPNQIKMCNNVPPLFAIGAFSICSLGRNVAIGGVGADGFSFTVTYL
jgi:hypothetical protein